MKKVILILMSLYLCIFTLSSVLVSAENIDPSRYYEYTISGTKATITGYFGFEKSLDIPLKLGGKKVTKIGKYAFSGNTKLTTIKMGNNISSIGMSAF